MRQRETLNPLRRGFCEESRKRKPFLNERTGARVRDFWLHKDWDLHPFTRPLFYFFVTSGYTD